MPQPNPNCTISILAHTRLRRDALSLTQLATAVRTLLGLIHAVAQPDLHSGTKYPIGAVFVSKAWIHPPLIGGDIGCGMAWYKSSLSRNAVDGERGKRVADELRGLEGAWRSQQERETWLTDGGDCCATGWQWDAALGTIGADSHFAEVQMVEAAAVSAGEDGGAGLAEDDVVRLVHSRSRGYGGDMLRRYAADGVQGRLGCWRGSRE
ncbi:hypothetical protein LTR04_001210 [Oleoguttula sp. CCFEE 6159]|nr:hypothetical protein LTR04_001210 [Oleoguttula sp. CCFEE 6159]